MQQLAFATGKIYYDVTLVLLEFSAGQFRLLDFGSHSPATDSFKMHAVLNIILVAVHLFFHPVWSFLER
jgi:hypothetical protein